MTNEDIKTGVVVHKDIDKGYGFIKNLDEKKVENIFFHASDVADPEFEGLKIGTHVNYLISKNHKGLKATSIIRIYKKIQKDGK